jgi:hypothetical protein
MERVPDLTDIDSQHCDDDDDVSHIHCHKSHNILYTEDDKVSFIVVSAWSSHKSN